jgi:hypothetical protein
LRGLKSLSAANGILNTGGRFAPTAQFQSGEHLTTIETLAVATKLHRETVRRAIDDAARTGWVQREPRRTITGDRLTDARITGWNYFACIPNDQQLTDEIEQPWDRDPTWTSERRNRPRSKRGHVPAHDRDKSQPVQVNVPAHDRHVPVLRGDVPVLSGDVPAQDRISSPLHDLINTSSSRDALTRTAIDLEIDETDPEQEPEAERKPQALAPARPSAAPRRLASPGSFARTEEPEPERFSKAQAAARDFGITEPDRLARMFQLTPERAQEAIA